MTTQHTLFPADADATEPRERRTLTKEDIDKVRHVEGFPIATDEAIIALSDPPHYTACPNPFLADFIAEHGKPYDEASDDYHREPFAADVSEGKNDPIYNAHSYHTKVPHKAIMRYILHYTEPGDIVFDGFCGTGMTGVAAQLCGDRTAVESLGYRVDRDGTVYEGKAPISKLGARKAVLSDLSPAATFIAYNYNTPVDVAAFEREAKRILAEVEAECGWMYETTHTDGRKGRINYMVWSDVFVCPNCGRDVVFVDEALDLETKKVRETFHCKYCSAEITKRSMERLYESFYDTSANATFERPRRVPVLINYESRGQRFEKKPSEFDELLLQKIAQQEFNAWFPASKLPYMHMTHERARLDLYGVSYIHHFYFPRALYSLSLLWLKAQQVKDQRVRRFMLFTVEQTVWGMSVLARYAPTHFSQVNQYLSGVYYVASMISEVSPWYILNSKTDRLAKAFKTYQPLASRVTVTTNSCESTQLPKNSVDYIFTDPPFGENIYYADLNYLIESWHGITTQAAPEAIVDQAKKKNLDDYQGRMTKCFTTYFRVLKPGRWMTVEFHNSSSAVWNTIQEGISRAGFVIADVRTLDKQQSSYRQVTAASAAKQDLVISAYKPRAGFEQQFEREKGTHEGAWSFVREHLGNVPVFVESKAKAEVIAERLPYLLFDRMVAFHLQRGASVPLSAAEFYAGLRSRFPERDGMHFLETQAAEYDAKRAAVGSVEQFTFYVSDEKSSIQWLRQLLAGGPLTYQDIQPKFLQELQQSRNELLPELRLILQANFLQDDQGRWYIPDATKQVDLEKLRKRELLREYATYTQGRGKLKSVRSEAVRAGFEEAYRTADYAGILAVAARLPEAVLREDSAILTYYDLAQMEIEG